jgi:hypothetical protein
MMLTGRATAPTYGELRPMKEPTSPTFPVYHDLADRLAHPAESPDRTVAHALGTCAGYAYSDEHTVSMMMARMGLAENRCLMVAENVDAMFICSTAFLVQSSCRRVVILCYRGTQPANFINWLTDADVNPEKVSFPLPEQGAGALMHGGFYRNVRATRYAVVTALEKALRGESVLEGEDSKPGRPLEALYVTGHSLGGAMAALMGVMLTIEPEYRQLSQRLKAVYTFGQPMVGNSEFAKACADNPFLSTRTFRYVFGADIVPSLPPTVSGDFVHFGPEYALKADSHGDPESRKATTQLTHLSELVGAPLGFLTRQIRVLRNLSLGHSFYDHGPQNYIAALRPASVRTEFGD